MIAVLGENRGKIVKLLLDEAKEEANTISGNGDWKLNRIPFVVHAKDYYY